MRYSQTIRLKYIWSLKFEAHGQHPTLPSSRARDATTRRPPLKLHPPELYSCSSWTLYAQGVQLYLRSTVFSKNHGMRVKTLGEEIARRQRLNQNNNPSVIAHCPSWYPTRKLSPAHYLLLMNVWAHGWLEHLDRRSSHRGSDCRWSAGCHGNVGGAMAPSDPPTRTGGLIMSSQICL